MPVRYLKFKWVFQVSPQQDAIQIFEKVEGLIPLDPSFLPENSNDHNTGNTGSLWYSLALGVPLFAAGNPNAPRFELGSRQSSTLHL
ncbi:hypothetical protein OAM01_01250 [bacterium]|nr:hypothetical protein [bacterium]